jgi:exopolysaccharide biosynthesis polyprenyl glycosylphosphotransferase
MRPRRLLVLTDILNGILAVLLEYLVARLRHTSPDQMGITLSMGALTVLLSLGLLLRSRQYSEGRRMTPLFDIGVLIRDVVIAAAIATLLSYLTKGFFTGLTTPSRVAVGAALLAFLALAAIARLSLSAYQRRQFARGRAVRKVLLVGDGATAADFLDFVKRRPWLGIRVDGRLTFGSQPTFGEEPDADYGDAGSAEGPDSAARTLPVFAVSDTRAGFKRLDQALRATQATEVVIALDPEERLDFDRMAGLLALAHVPFKIVPSLFGTTFRTAELLGYAELPVIDVDVDALDRLSRTVKRTMDVSLSLLVLLVLLPLELLAAAAIVVESGRPVFFKQQRVGKNGRRFTVYKFRTMTQDAESHLKELEAQNELGDSGGRMFKMRKDPRVTRVGAILRKLSLDEFPQFLNVVRGEMSVVGPRPPLPEEVERYEREHLYRLRALPGITGLWQVSGRNELSFEDMVRLDRYYLDNWSLGLDLSIILRTIPIVFTGRGAY